MGQRQSRINTTAGENATRLDGIAFDGKTILTVPPEPGEDRDTRYPSGAGPRVTVPVADTAVDEKRTTLSLSLTISDKKALKMRSLKEGKAMAAIIHEWIGEWKDEAVE